MAGEEKVENVCRFRWGGEGHCGAVGVRVGDGVPVLVGLA